MISAEILKHSSSWIGKDIVTYKLTYPRYIHGELMTHRVFSKNAGGSRAITIGRLIKRVQDSPATPIWTLNQKGMQGPPILEEAKLRTAQERWLEARDAVINQAEEMSHIGIHKQNVNRMLEPWMHMEIVLTGTDFDNWFKLRDHPDAQPEIQELAQKMRESLNKSIPQYLDKGMWHIPFEEGIEFEETYPFDGEQNRQNLLDKLKISVARCARVSYFNFDGGQDKNKDIELYEKLIVSEPLHASPAEHQARVPHPYELKDMEVIWHFTQDPEEHWEQKRGKYFSNLTGWVQLRKVIECGEF